MDMATVEEEEEEERIRQEKHPKTASSPPSSSHPVTKGTGGDGADDDTHVEGAHEKAKSKLSSDGGSGNKKSSREVLTIDPDVLHCAICSGVLSPPIFQSYNGRLACISCRLKVEDNCPSCKRAISFRNLAVEKIMESVKVPCPYASSGCEQLINFLNVHVHKEMCEYSPCYCPAAGCTFEATMRELYHHFVQGHPDRSTSFQYSQAFDVVMSKRQHFRVLHAQEDEVLFLLLNIINETEFRMGNAVIVACLGPDSMDGKHTYKVKAKDDLVVSSVQLKSPMSNIRRWEEADSLPEKNFLLIAEDYGGLYLDLKITIWNKKYS